MSVFYIKRPSKVGKIDQFYIGLDPTWLGSELIVNPTVVAESSEITIGAITTDGNRIYFLVTGVSVGETVVSINYETSGGRSDCKHVTIKCVDC